MSHEGKQVARWAAHVAGSAVVGAGIGLLLAPQTGTETRREIARYAKKAQIQATRWSRAVQSGVKEVMDRTKRPMVEAVHSAPAPGRIHLRLPHSVCRRNGCRLIARVLRLDRPRPRC